MSRGMLFIILIGVVGAAVYIGFQYVPTAPPADVEGEELRLFLARLQRLKNIQLDTSALQNPLFRALIAPDPVPPAPSELGRTNPFVPIGGASTPAPK